VKLIKGERYLEIIPTTILNLTHLHKHVFALCLLKKLLLYLLLYLFLLYHIKFRNDYDGFCVWSERIKCYWKSHNKFEL